MGLHDSRSGAFLPSTARNHTDTPLCLAHVNGSTYLTRARRKGKSSRTLQQRTNEKTAPGCPVDVRGWAACLMRGTCFQRKENDKVLKRNFKAVQLQAKRREKWETKRCTRAFKNNNENEYGIGAAQSMT